MSNDNSLAAALDNPPPVGRWNYPTPIRFGPGCIEELPAACSELGISRPLLVTDPGLVDLAITKQAVAILGRANLDTAVFSDMRPNPVGRDVVAGVAAFKASGADGVVAFGGGSALDVAKAVALMVGQCRPLFDFEDRADWWTRIDPDGMVPLVAVPTTSGTGSEVGRASVITDESDHTKKIIFHPKMLPGRVVADPALTIGLPPHLTAWTGIDALSHNLEAWCAPGFHPLADGVALEGMRLIHRSLVRAYTDGTDIRARSDLMAGSLMGATAFQKGLGGMHALAHPIGARHDCHHGRTNAVLMPYILAWNRAAIAPRIERLARYLDLPGGGFDAFLQWVLEVRTQLEIPHTLHDLGVPRDDLDALSVAAESDPSAGGNPTPFDAAAARAVLLRAFHGDVSGPQGVPATEARA
jgi:alcohol dehydrogenase class IV